MWLSLEKKSRIPVSKIKSDFFGTRVPNGRKGCKVAKRERDDC